MDRGMLAGSRTERLFIEAELGDFALGVHIAVTGALAGDFYVEGST
jgi:hypothetical protein